jgi:hypothetical protein
MLVSGPTMRAWTNDEDATLRRLYPAALIPACSSCNFAKHDKTPAEWYTQRALRRL